jgi:hypothetical protein
MMSSAHFSRLPILAAALVLGLALGWMGGRQNTTPGDESADASQKNPGTTSSPKSTVTTQPGTLPPSLATNPSPGTLSDLLALPENELYPRLAHWLLDADVEEIAAFWQKYQPREKRDRELINLVFVNWTRHDPLGAIAATEGSIDDHYAWWAWTCHEPDAALDYARNVDDIHLQSVLWGLGEFHPDWVHEHIDELPPELRRNLLAGFSKWPQAKNQEEAIRLLASERSEINPADLTTLARQNPEKAATLLGELSGRRFERTVAKFFQTLELQDPALLGEIARELPSPVQRINLELSALRRQVWQDPAAALQRYREETNPMIKNAQLQILGSALLQTNPDAAFSLLSDWARSDQREQRLTIETDSNHTRLEPEIESYE